MNAYTEHQAVRARLEAALAALEPLLGTLGAPRQAERLQRARAQLAEGRFRLLVVGEFKRGKSTLINALLGAELLPSKVAPCTGLATEVRHGERPEAWLFSRDGAEPPREVPVEAIADYVVIAEDDEEEDERPPSPYAKLELRYPLAWAHDELVIIDSPGLNEHATRTALALDALAAADAIVWVLSCRQPPSPAERAFWREELGGRAWPQLFLLWNHADALGDDDAAWEQARACAASLGEGAAADRLFFVSAREALLARKAGVGARLAASGLPAFEAALTEFLAQERGRAKLLGPLRALRTALDAAVREALPRSEALAQEPFAAVAARCEAERPKLDELERRRETLLRAIERRREALLVELAASYRGCVAEAERVLFEAGAAVEVGVWAAIAERRSAQRAIAERLQAAWAAHLDAWQANALKPLLERHLAALREELEAEGARYAETLDGLARALRPEPEGAEPAPAAELAPGERWLSALGGWFVGGPGAAIDGASSGFDGLRKGLVLHVGTGFALAALGLSAPIALPLMALVGVGRSLWEAQDVAATLRRRLAAEMADQLQRGAPAVIAGLGERLTLDFDGLLRTAREGLALAREEALGRLDQVLAEREDAERHWREALMALGGVRAKLEALAAEAQALEAALAPGAPVGAEVGPRAEVAR